MARGELSELVKARVDRDTKIRLQQEATRQNRSEGAIVRIALRSYLLGRQSVAEALAERAS